MNKYLISSIIVVLCVLLASNLYFYQRSEILAQQHENDIKNQKDLASIYDSLAGSYAILLKKTNYSISLSPVIDTKINSILGSSKQLTFQYYFTMDGNKIELKPDSTITLRK